jgi:2-phospho-L-lactate guanylyltransferase
VRVAVLIPVKAFRIAKVRLAPALGPAERAQLAEAMATHVVGAARPLPVAVVCDDAEVRAWAEDAGAGVIWTPGLGLDGAVEAGVSQLAADGFDRVVVAHGDLPLAAGLAGLGGGEGVVLVPDRRDDGTNVIALPTQAGFRFAYGPGSFSRHRAESLRLGLRLDVRRDAALGWDVDVPGDLLPPGGLPAGWAATRVDHSLERP